MSKLVLGATGLLGRAIFRQLEDGCQEEIFGWSSADYDLTTADNVVLANRFQDKNVDTIYMCAGKVGGIKANMENQFEFFQSNTRMAVNVISAAQRAAVPKLIYVSSSCAYTPGKSLLPSDNILSGPVEPTNEGYAYAKLIGMYAIEKAAERGFNYRTVIPCNLYGPGSDNSTNGHVLGVLVKKVVDAKHSCGSVEVWGTGKPRREFLHVADAARFIVQTSNMPDAHIYPIYRNINIGAGYDVSIRELVNMIADVADFRGPIYYNDEYPDGAYQKLLDIGTIDFHGSKPQISLREGIAEMIADYESDSQRVVNVPEFTFKYTFGAVAQ